MKRLKLVDACSLPPGTYTRVTDANSACTWSDHIVATETLQSRVVKCNVCPPRSGMQSQVTVNWDLNHAANSSVLCHSTTEMDGLMYYTIDNQMA